MKQLFLLLSTVFLFTMSCSDPCDSVNCNKGTCSDGTCICDTGYEGDDCSTEMRTKFIGTWTGLSVCGSVDRDNVTVTISADSAIIDKVSLLVDGANLPAKVSKKTLTLEEIDLFGLKVSGSGKITSANQLELTLNQDDEGVKSTCTFTGTK